MGPIEAKAYVGTLTTFGAGYVSTLLLETIPWLMQHLTPDQQKNLPIFIATVFTAIASYYAPHTHRPDLAPVTPPVIVQAAPAAPAAPAALAITVAPAAPAGPAAASFETGQAG